MMNIILLLVGVGLLTAGGEILIRGALGAAKRFGVSPLLSGLVIVGFGTSSPELAVSVDAAIQMQPDIAIGNVVGSNIGNILLILGICAIITPMTVKPMALRRDAIVVVLSSILFVFLVGGNALGRFDSLILLLGLTGYLLWAYFTERDQPSPVAELHKSESEELSKLPQSLLWTSVSILLGLALLIGGSQVLLKGAIGIAEIYNVSEAVIGLTLVAVGTSLPELTISVIAAIRKHADVAVGNILGSNIFNLLGILGISAFLQPLPVNARILEFDQWVMLGASLVLFLFLYTGRRVNRMEGFILLIAYTIYVALTFTIFG